MPVWSTNRRRSGIEVTQINSAYLVLIIFRLDRLLVPTLSAILKFSSENNI